MRVLNMTNSAHAVRSEMKHEGRGNRTAAFTT